MIHFDRFWCLLKHFDTIWCSLTRFDAFCTNWFVLAQYFNIFYFFKQARYPIFGGWHALFFSIKIDGFWCVLTDFDGFWHVMTCFDTNISYFFLFSKQARYPMFWGWHLLFFGIWSASRSYVDCHSHFGHRQELMN